MAGALGDFGKRTTGYKVGVFVVIGLLLGGLYWQFVFKKLKRERDTARDDHAGLVTKNDQLDKDAKENTKLITRSDELNRQIAENQKALPTEAELPAFFDTLGRKVAEAGVEVKRWDYQKEVPLESYVKVPIDVEITGTFYQIKRFFASLVQRDPVPVPRPDGTTGVEERERIVTIENFQLHEPKVKNRELVMTAKFTASTFRQDVAAPDEKDKDKPGTPPKPGDKPAPSSTPAGAKANTEKALEKSEDRAAGGSGSGSADKLKGGVP